ncbi:hypothetical protein AAG906_040696 [Vitis piasezkii]
MKCAIQLKENASPPIAIGFHNCVGDSKPKPNPQKDPNSKAKGSCLCPLSLDNHPTKSQILPPFPSRNSLFPRTIARPSLHFYSLESPKEQVMKPLPQPKEHVRRHPLKLANNKIEVASSNHLTLIWRNRFNEPSLMRSLTWISNSGSGFTELSLKI